MKRIFIATALPISEASYIFRILTQPIQEAAIWQAGLQPIGGLKNIAEKT